MKKTALILIIAALSMIMSASVASTGGKEWKGFHGTYAMTGSGSCLFSFTTMVPGFPPPAPVPPDPNPWVATLVQEGIWSFEHNGSGTFRGSQFGMALPPYPSPNATPVEIKFDFDYYVAHDGKITVNVIPDSFSGTYLAGPMSKLNYFLVSEMTMFGQISSDHKSMTLTNGDAGTTEIMEVQILKLPNTRLLYGICNVGRTLIRVDK